MRNDSFKDFVLDQLGEMAELTGRSMFGGYGLYHRATFFGIIHKGRLFFKTNDMTQPAYASRGMLPFRPNARQTLKRYYEVPLDILEDRTDLAVWARMAAVLPCAQLSLPFTDSLREADGNEDLSMIAGTEA
jgi:Regulator of competence-specific genes